MNQFERSAKLVKQENRKIADTPCPECGEKALQSYSQATCPSTLYNAMEDVISCKCSKCGENVSFTFPLRSPEPEDYKMPDERIAEMFQEKGIGYISDDFLEHLFTIRSVHEDLDSLKVPRRGPSGLVYTLMGRIIAYGEMCAKAEREKK